MRPIDQWWRATVPALWPALAGLAGLARQVVPHSSKAWQQILKLRQFNLQTAFTAPSSLSKDIENQLGAIEDFAREQVFEVSPLRR